MNTKNIELHRFQQNTCLWVILLLLGLTGTGYSQSMPSYVKLQSPDMLDDNQVHDVPYADYAVYDYTIPSSATANSIYLELKGGDGGKRWSDDGMAIHWTRNGGGGAIVKVNYKIGNGENDIPPLSTLRFIVGSHGDNWRTSEQYGAGGGNATAVFMKNPADNTWTLLAVAGSGGGAYGDDATDSPGKSAEAGEDGSNGHKATVTDAGKNGGDAGGKNTGNGGLGIYSIWKGATGPNNQTVAPIPFEVIWGSALGGFRYIAGGGGGGFSGGGGGGGYGGGGGGGSFINFSKTISYFEKITTGNTADPQNGYAKYKLDQSGFQTIDQAIHLTTNMSKCFDVYGGGTSSGSNVQLYHCTNNSNQQWLIDGDMIRYFKQPEQCLELSGSNATNSANIDIWACNEGTNAQKWIYDGIRQTIRSRVNLKYCIDLLHTNTADGTNLQLYDCHGGDNQKWTINGRTPTVADVHNRIKLVGNTGKCVDVYAAGTANGTNIQVYHCHYAASQFWNFVDNTIKFELDTNKCLDLNQSNTVNGANIQLYGCNGTNAQQWIYDANTKAFRSWINPDKCIDVKDGNFNDDSNIQIWDCNGTSGQQFLLDPVDPCYHDTTPPVAKCKDFKNNGDIIPHASDFDAGSYDNCAISTITYEPVGSSVFKLIVTDTSGNTSSCIANVYD